MHMFTLSLHKDNRFTLHSWRNNRFPTTEIIDADNADDLLLFSDIISQAETTLHSVEHSDKTEYIRWNQNGIIKTVSGTLSELYKGIYLSSCRIGINTHIGKAWGAISKFVWKSGLPDNMKRSLFQATFTTVVWLLNMGPYLKTRWNLHSHAKDGFGCHLKRSFHQRAIIWEPSSSIRHHQRA